MNHVFILLISFGDINLVEICNVNFNVSLCDLNVNDGLLIFECCQYVSVFFVLIGKITDHFILFKFHLSVLRL